MVYKLLIFLSFISLACGQLKCYACGGSNLDDCKSVSTPCRPEQNRCWSLLIEGGEVGRTYYKRCARANECTTTKLDAVCKVKQEIEQATLKCRPSCCEVTNCNHSNRQVVSWMAVVMVILITLQAIF